MHAPVISIGHLSMSTRQKLTEDDNVFGLQRIVYDHGVFVFAIDEPSFFNRTDYEDIPADLTGCFRWAWGKGFEWVRFDVAGDAILSLPLFDKPE